MMNQDMEDQAKELAELTDATRKLCRLHGDLGLVYPKTVGLATSYANPGTRPAPEDNQPLLPSAHTSQTQEPKQPVFPAHDIGALKDTIIHCERCVVEAKRPTPLFGTGRQDRPALFIISDAISSEGLKQGSIFPGQEGELLGKMLAAIKLGVEDVFLTNIIKCALNSNEVTLATQVQNCRPHLLEQINLFRPLIICTMGQVASQAMLGSKNKLIALRGRFHTFNDTLLMATYHPSQLLQVPDLKKAAWYDLQLIQHKLKQLQKT